MSRLSCKPKKSSQKYGTNYCGCMQARICSAGFFLGFPLISHFCSSCTRSTHIFSPFLYFYSDVSISSFLFGIWQSSPTFIRFQRFLFKSSWNFSKWRLVNFRVKLFFRSLFWQLHQIWNKYSDDNAPKATEVSKYLFYFYFSILFPCQRCYPNSTHHTQVSRWCSYHVLSLSLDLLFQVISDRFDEIPEISAFFRFVYFTFHQFRRFSLTFHA